MRTLLVAAAIVCLLTAVGLQTVRDRTYSMREQVAERILYVRSGEAVKRMTLGFDALAADVYWIRAIQHYGGDRRTGTGPRRYELLYPLLDLTTTLDPYFTIAYRFGAIFLSEAVPGGPGRPDQAERLLRKGIAAQPGKWQYYYDIGFVHYWHARDYQAAASWFQRAQKQPNSPNWLQPLTASMLTTGNDRAAARFLWQQMLQSDQEWLRRNAERRLLQIDALDLVDRIDAFIKRNPGPPGEQVTWEALMRRTPLRRVPTDPAGTPIELDPATGRASVSTTSPLQPMPNLDRPIPNLDRRPPS